MRSIAPPRRRALRAVVAALAVAACATAASPTRADVVLSISKTYTAAPGGSVNVTVDLANNEAAGIDLAGLSIALSFDTGVFTISNVQAGSLLSGGLAANLAFSTAVPGVLTASTFTVTPQSLPFGATGSVLSFTLTNNGGSTPASSVINLLANAGSTTTTAEGLSGAYTLNPAPTNGAGDAVDGLVTFSAIPEPSQYAMAGVLAGLGALRHGWRRRRARAAV